MGILKIPKENPAVPMEVFPIICLSEGTDGGNGPAGAGTQASRAGELPGHWFW